MTVVKVTVDTKEVRDILRRLSPRLNESVRKKAIRKAAKPFTAALKALWISAPYKGKNPHRKAIAAATKLNSPKRMGGEGSPIRVELGVILGKKGGARAKGMQYVYPWLENGFKHKASGKFIPGSKRSLAWGTANVNAFMRSIATEILVEARKILGAKNVA
jgi:hypothetical protein